ncbi:putative periplasmic protein [Flavobacterium limnosediminis JC2902]|uniref:Putative periplasmic protein n=1 Tax=Flavobacterium limnosediminis JC2902 TaxID=1341181 RepID=V6SLG6_9FLAO|nr:phosphodiester glycosidase family protein [Flavobacterium limnosediminis]ESU25225.1 putative periplasmic protein [Flavobacterium limnosediminis JC2902]
MTKKVAVIFLIIISSISVGFYVQSKKSKIDHDRFISYVVNPKKRNVEFYWKNEKGENFKNAENLKFWLKKQKRELVFATNGGMYKKDNSPQGLYIENKIKKIEIDTAKGNGNFYLKPNGVFYITIDKTPNICLTNDFVDNGKIKYATQSGPMLVINGKIHSAFKENSTNLNIRNGVGILPNNEIIFAMSKKEINFYEFAQYFKNLGCKNALYLDGFVSRTYLPEKNWIQTDGDFGVIIGVTK